MKVIFLDALGTLIELEPPAPHLQSELAHRFGVRITAEDAQRAIAAEIAYYRAHLNEGRDRAGIANLRRRCADVLRAALAGYPQLGGHDLTDALLASLRFNAFPDVEPALRAARARELGLVVVSNWDASLHEVLERIGLRPLLDAVVTSAETGAAKPNPAIFAAALAQARAQPADAVHVGDSIREDVEGARAAGITPVLLQRLPGPRPPETETKTIASLSELALT